jgi:hypothetical protein
VECNAVLIGDGLLHRPFGLFDLLDARVLGGPLILRVRYVLGLIRQMLVLVGDLDQPLLVLMQSIACGLGSCAVPIHAAE